MVVVSCPVSVGQLMQLIYCLVAAAGCHLVNRCYGITLAARKTRLDPIVMRWRQLLSLQSGLPMMLLLVMLLMGGSLALFLLMHQMRLAIVMGQHGLLARVGSVGGRRNAAQLHVFLVFTPRAASTRELIRILLLLRHYRCLLCLLAI